MYWVFETKSGDEGGKDEEVLSLNRKEKVVVVGLGKEKVMVVGLGLSKENMVVMVVMVGFFLL